MVILTSLSITLINVINVINQNFTSQFTKFANQILRLVVNVLPCDNATHRAKCHVRISILQTSVLLRQVNKRVLITDVIEPAASQVVPPLQTQVKSTPELT